MFTPAEPQGPNSSYNSGMVLNAKTLKQGLLFFLGSLAFWVSYAPLMALEDKIRLAQRGLHTPFWLLTLVDSSWCICFAILTPPIFYIVSRYPVAKPKTFRRTLYYVLGVIPFILVFACLRWLIMPPWNPLEQHFMMRSWHSFLAIMFNFADQSWTYTATVIAAHAYEYSNRARKQELERAELQQALAVSELQMLKSQLHPHFLFNTLHGIATLIDTNQVRAKSMIVQLSGLLRTALQHGNFDLITLDEELKFASSYLDLEKMRLDNRLKISWEIEPQTRQLLIPQMILQPLVENAILHGIACCREGGWIKITSRRKPEGLEIQIHNSVGGKSQHGTGVGLQNTTARLKYLFAGESFFSFVMMDNGLAVSTLQIPAFASHQRNSAEASITVNQEKRMETDHAYIDR